MKLKSHMVCVLLGMLIVLCHGCDSCVSVEVSRQTSPDNWVDAVVVELQCSSVLVGDEVYVYLVEKGNEVSEKNRVLEGNHFKNVNVKWRHPGLLEITYDKADIRHFTSFWYTQDDKNRLYEVDIMEIPKVEPVPIQIQQNRNSP